jgi:hypothetical protein
MSISQLTFAPQLPVVVESLDYGFGSPWGTSDVNYSFLFSTSANTVNNVPIRLQRVGDWVTMSIPSTALLAIGNAGFCNNTVAIPEQFRPPVNSGILLWPAVANAVKVLGECEVASTGIITLAPFGGEFVAAGGNSGPFTGSATYFVGV